MALENYANFIKQFDPMEADQQIENNRALRNTNRLADLGFSEKQREIADTQKLNESYQNALGQDGRIDRNKLSSEVINRGIGKNVPALLKQFAEQDKANAETDKEIAQTGKLKSETSKIDHDAVKNQFELSSQIAGAWATDPSANKEKITRGLNAAYQAKIISPEAYNAKMEELNSLADDVKTLNDWGQRTVEQVMNAEKLYASKYADANAVLNADVLRKNNADSQERMRLNNEATNATSIENNKRLVAARDRATAATNAKMTTAKPIPATALKMQQEELDAIGTASGIQADLGAVQKQITDGKLNFGLVGNLINRGRNLANSSTEESRNFSSFESTLEKLRNDSLRLNKGVQTEGDSVRAWNELFKNLGDKKVVEQRLTEIVNINDRAAKLRKMNIDNIRVNYGHDPLDTTGYENLAPAIGDKKPPTTPPTGADSNSVTLPNGKVMNFANAEKAAAFKKAAGLN